jgi:Fe-S-cluster-containing dehydrogenase component/DMSO reductase anchor subunit
MRKGFIFNHNKCVSCNACNAACIIENGWNVHPRTIFTYNTNAESIFPVINLSLACNHCESAVCMDGCPTSAYSRDIGTGAIVLDEKRCIGCRYCQWNCPYDAPKYHNVNNVIEKCNMCYPAVIEGRQPACSSACPTGALSFGPLTDSISAFVYSWFPDKKLEPAVEFTAKRNGAPVKIIPENIFGQIEYKPAGDGKNFLKEVSLILFSFLATVSVAATISSFIKGVYPGKMIFILILLAGISSFLHLGKILRSWRSVTNIRNSPLSREIAAFIAYTLFSLMTLIFLLPGFLIASSVTGLIFLIIIDSVYIFSGNRRSVILHSGQTFISALLMVSFFSGIILPLIFIGLIKLVLSLYNLSKGKINNNLFGLRFMRIVFLVVSFASMISHISYPGIFVVSIFLLGEFIDRILFYIDFNPLNINRLINEQVNIERDEKNKG